MATMRVVKKGLLPDSSVFCMHAHVNCDLEPLVTGLRCAFSHVVHTKSVSVFVTRRVPVLFSISYLL